MASTAEIFWNRYLDLLPAGHRHRVARPQVFSFGDSQELSVELADLVRAGRKRATASLPVEFTAVGDPLPMVGDIGIVTLADGAPVAIVEFNEVRRVPFGAIDAGFAAAEGEGDGSLEYWRAAHRAYFGRVGAALGGGFDESTLVICQRFTLLWGGGDERVS